VVLLAAKSRGELKVRIRRIVSFLLARSHLLLAGGRFASFSVSHTLLLPLVFLVSVAVLLLLCLAKSAGELRVRIRPFFSFFR
jgi:hypothetical protein